VSEQFHDLFPNSDGIFFFFLETHQDGDYCLGSLFLVAAFMKVDEDIARHCRLGSLLEQKNDNI
jgi:hypothetical protein